MKGLNDMGTKLLRSSLTALSSFVRNHFLYMILYILMVTTPLLVLLLTP